MQPDPSDQSNPNRTGQLVLVGVVAVAIIGAAVALVFAGWNGAQIGGLLAAVAAIVIPLIVNVVKTDHVRVLTNSTHDRIMQRQDQLEQTIQTGGLVLPADPNARPTA